MQRSGSISCASLRCRSSRDPQHSDRLGQCERRADLTPTWHPNRAPTRCCSATRPAEATLLEAMRSGRMHHAWLITGPGRCRQGDARLPLRPPAARGHARRSDTLALDPTHPVFRRVAAGAHADLLTVERAYDEKRRRMRTQIAVEDVRRISDFMSLTPAEGGWRVVIVDGAEEMNQSSANALLKILEEPPRRAILLLVCARARPAAADHPQPLPPPAARSAGAGGDGATAGGLSAGSGRR